MLAEILNERMPAGLHQIEFSDLNLKSGLYFYKLRTDSFTNVKSMIKIEK